MITKRQLLFAAAALAALGALAWAFAPRPLQVEVAVVERGRFEQSIEEDGRTRLRERFVVSAPVTARLSRISLREGDRVGAGDAIAVLTPVMSAMVDDRSLREAAARLGAAQAGVQAAAARVERARLAQEEARLELQRAEKLGREGFVSASRVDGARLAFDSARRELEAAGAAREVSVHERAQAAIAVQPPAGTATGRPLVIRSPVAGVVLKVPLQSEGTVTAGTPLLEIGDPARMEVVAELLTTDAVQARPGTRVLVERWGGPAVEGVVRRVEPAAFTKVSALGVEEQRVNVLVDVTRAPEAWSGIGDGFRVTARVIVAGVDDALTVPVGALFPHGDGGGMAVYRLEGGRVKLQPVELGGRNGSVGWVRSGLQAGQPVILYPAASVVDGRRAEIRRP